MRDAVALARISHVLSFIDVFHSIGAPVERALKRCGLPGSLADQPDEYVAVWKALSFIRSIAIREGLDELPALVAQRIQYGQLSQELLRAVSHCPTILTQLERFAALVHLENNRIVCRVLREGDKARICVDLADSRNMPGGRYSEWVQLIVVISLLRATLGNKWLPKEICFQSTSPFSDISLGDYAATRVRFHQPHTSITVPVQNLATESSNCVHYFAPNVANESNRPRFPFIDFVPSLKQALRPYLGEGIPTVDTAAEICNTSPRSLQRLLGTFGLTFTRLLNEVQFEVAAELLRDPGLKSLDIAHAVGFEDPSHFARAFRRIAGTSPTEYRHAQLRH